VRDGFLAAGARRPRTGIGSKAVAVACGTDAEDGG
jgi:hypothetical protein